MNLKFWKSGTSNFSSFYSGRLASAAGLLRYAHLKTRKLADVSFNPAAACFNKVVVSFLVLGVLTPIADTYAFGPGLRGSTSIVTRNLAQQVRHALKPVLYVDKHAVDPIKAIFHSKNDRYILTSQEKSLVLWAAGSA